mmetsp:Transcript_45691/g.132327  ORF Transcript_45691/g.132327 Transcript_45691/m.132327 type:complete len:764 (+) Transcript_45691:76-2367(+)
MRRRRSLVALPPLLAWLVASPVPLATAVRRHSLRETPPLAPGPGTIAEDGANPLLSYAADGPLPALAAVRPAHARPAVEARLAEGRERLVHLESLLTQALNASSEPVAYEELVLPLEELYEHAGRPWEFLNHLKSVKDSPELRKAMEELEPKVVAFWQTVSQSRPIYDALARLNTSAAFPQLSEARQRVVHSELVSRRLNGMGLPDKSAEEFNRVQRKLQDLSTTFENHLLDARKNWSLTLSDASVVRGIPARALAAAAEAARAAGVGGATEGEGPWRLSLEAPVLGPVLLFAEDRGLREKLFRAQATLASGGPHDNSGTVRDILDLRRRQAELLGLPDYLAVSLASKMATREEVHHLLEDLQATAHPAALREEQELRDFAARTGNISTLQLWDRSFYAERLKQESYGVNTEELRAYLPLPAVLQGLFALSDRLFGASAALQQDGLSQVRWHADVQVYRISREGTTAGYVLLDPYSRPHEKRAGAWMQPLVSRRSFNDSVRLPTAAMVMNFPPPPTPDSPSLLSLGEVETLFHEFGHALQHVLTVQNETAVSGINGVEWDAVEIASQFMEYWVDFDRRTFYSFARHHETSEPLPESTYRKLQNAHSFRAGAMLLGQVYLGKVDLQLHEQRRTDGDPNEIEKAVAKAVLVTPTLPEARPLCSFSHVFAGGYAAGYYSYQWSKVLSADAFGAFPSGARNNASRGGAEQELAERRLGRRFAATLLALGGGRAPADTFASFRGRAASADALLRLSGLGPLEPTVDRT